MKQAHRRDDPGRVQQREMLSRRDLPMHHVVDLRPQQFSLIRHPGQLALELADAGAEDGVLAAAALELLCLRSESRPGGGPQATLPPLSSPLARQYLLALSTFALAAIGLVCAFVAGWSCDFASVSYSYEGELDGEEFAGYEGDGYEGLPSSIGIFCTDNDNEAGGTDGRRTVSRAFLGAALGWGCVLLLPTIGISTVLPASNKLWLGISCLAALAFACQLPVFLLLDSGACNAPGAKCTLGRGSIPIFLSLGAYMILALGVQWNDCPEWKEEYALWKLMHKRKPPGGIERGQTQEVDEEQGYAQDSAHAGYVDDRGEPNILNDLQALEATGRKGTRTTMPQHVTSSQIERMDLLSHDDLIPRTNDTPIVLQADAPGMDEGTRKAKKKLVAHLLREERTRGTAPGSPLRNRMHALGRIEIARKERAPPVRYVSIHEDSARRSNSPWEQSMDDGNVVQAATNDDEDEAAVPVTPGRKIAARENVSPITQCSIAKGSAVDASAKKSEGQAVTPTKATPNRAPAAAVAVSPMTACTGIRSIMSGDAGEDTQKEQRSRVETEKRVHGRAGQNADSTDAKKGVLALDEVSSFSEPFLDVFGTTVVSEDDAEAEGDKDGLLANDCLDVAYDIGDIGDIAYDIGDIRDEIPMEAVVRRPAPLKAHSANRLAPAREIDASASVSSASTNLTSNRSRKGRRRVAHGRLDGALASDGEASRRSNASASKKKLPMHASTTQQKSDQVVHVIEDDESKDGGSSASGQWSGVMSSLSRQAKKASMRKKRASATEQQSVDGPASPRIVSPEKDTDPDLVFYQSESSMSTLSLPTDDYRSSDDDYYFTQQPKKPPLAPIVSAPAGGNVGDPSASDDSELSQVIAGVNKKLNRKTSGKITPLNKRRRRKKSSQSSCDDSDYSTGYSSHGSLLDEVIVEEGELNASNEVEGAKPLLRKGRSSIPMIIDASPSPRKKRKDRSKSRGGRAGDGYVSLDEAIPDDECNSQGNNSGYESGYASPRVGKASEAEESFSSRAARARRNRLLTKRRQTHPELEAASAPYAKLESPTGPDDEPATVRRPDAADGSVDRGMNHRSPPKAKLSDGGDGGGDTAAWRARKVRMARLQRMHGAPAAAAAAEISVAGRASEQSDDEFERMEEVIRAHDSVELACSSDEDSI